MCDRSRPSPWFFCIDDDGWVSAFPTLQALRDFLEPEHIEEMVVLMDSCSRAYELVDGELRFTRGLPSGEILAHTSTCHGYQATSADDIGKWFSWHSMWSVVL